MEALLRPDLLRIVLTGSECTGKTTLAQQLAAHFDVEWVPEFVRDFAETRTGPITAHDHDAIARGQIARENACAARATALLIQDTDLLSTVVYAHHYVGAIAPWIAEAAQLRRPTLYLLMDIDVPWVADATRDRGHMREEMHRLFRTAVEASGAPWELIRGSGDERFDRARSAISGLLGPVRV